MGSPWRDWKNFSGCSSPRSSSLPPREAGGGLMVAVVQLAIMSGAIAGGVLFDTSGYQATFGMSAVVLIIAAAFAVLAARSDRSQATG